MVRSHTLAPSCHFFLSVRANGSNDVTIPSAGRLRKYNHGWANWVASPIFLSVIYSNIWNSFKRDERSGINLIITGSARLRSPAIRRPDMKIHGHTQFLGRVPAILIKCDCVYFPAGYKRRQKIAGTINQAAPVIYEILWLHPRVEARFQDKWKETIVTFAR